MSKRIRELEQALDQRSREGEALRARIAQLEAELSQTRDELSNTDFELSKCKRSLDDFRSRSEAIVNALTEAHNTRERILKDARNAANNITSDANGAKKRILDEAQRTLDKARDEARKLIDDAGAEAQCAIDSANAQSEALISQAQSRCSSILAEAEAAAEQLRTDVNIQIEEKQNILSSLNRTIRAKAAEVLSQTESYAELLERIANEEPEQSEPDCAEISEAELSGCDIGGGLDETDAKSCSAPCGKQTPCCFAQDEEPVDTEEPESTEENNAAKDAAAETSLPEEYDSPATLMHSIYSIEGRSIPDMPCSDCGDEATDNIPVYDVGEATPLVVPSSDMEADDAKILVDDELESLIDEILRK